MPTSHLFPPHPPGPGNSCFTLAPVVPGQELGQGFEAELGSRVTCISPWPGSPAAGVGGGGQTPCEFLRPGRRAGACSGSWGQETEGGVSSSQGLPLSTQTSRPTSMHLPHGSSSVFPPRLRARQTQSNRSYFCFYL